MRNLIVPEPVMTKISPEQNSKKHIKFEFYSM
jgi:hypothetical protein